jgi:ribosomal protein S27E
MELILKNEQELLDTYVIKEYSNYYKCRCPSCGGNEAFVYKDNLNFINCSRKNKCGEVIKIKYLNHLPVHSIKNNKVKMLKNEDDIIKSILITEIISRIYLNKKYDSVITKNYRSINIDALKSIHMMNSKEFNEVLSPITYFKKEIFKDFLDNIIKLNYYDVVIPIVNEKTDMVERLIFRSSKQNNNYPKVIQKSIINDACKFLTYNLESNKIYFTETPLDAASLIEVDSEAGFICSIQASVPKEMIEFINLFKLNLQEKQIILAYDNDDAGFKTQEKLKQIFKSLKIKYNYLYFNEFKDANEVLQKNKNKLLDIINKPLNENEFIKIKSSSLDLKKNNKKQFLKEELDEEYNL